MGNPKDLVLSMFKLKSVTLFHRTDPKRVLLEVAKDDGSVSIIEFVSDSNITWSERVQ